MLGDGLSLRSVLDKLETDGAFYKHKSGEGPKGALTLVRLSYAFAEPVSIALFNAKGIKPRFPLNRLPAHLEFMGAGSMKLPDEVRAEHRIFAAEFSNAIGGTYKAELYDAGVRNAEATTKLKDFNLEAASQERAALKMSPVEIFEHLLKN
jgi:hypothetical protein